MQRNRFHPATRSSEHPVSWASSGTPCSERVGVLYRAAEAAVFTTGHHTHFAEPHLGHTCLPDLGKAFLATLNKSPSPPQWLSNIKNHDTHARTHYEFSFFGSVWLGQQPLCHLKSQVTCEATQGRASSGPADCPISLEDASCCPPHSSQSPPVCGSRQRVAKCIIEKSPFGETPFWTLPYSSPILCPALIPFPASSSSSFLLQAGFHESPVYLIPPTLFSLCRSSSDIKFTLISKSFIEPPPE